VAKLRTFFSLISVKNRVCVALSGGVDSAVAAHLLLTGGHAVEGVHMRTWQSEDGADECPWREDLESARAVAEHLRIPFRIENRMAHYREHVVEPLLEGYAAGRTPNPDVLCNRFIKFGLLLEGVLRTDCDFLATGHYCRLAPGPTGEPALFEGRDGTKDQSYFLAHVRREVLPRILFPLGECTKTQVRAMAKALKLPNADRKESQDVCFLGGKISMRTFLSRHLGENPGNIVTRDGRILGQHRGLFRYTIGQRKGIGVPSNRDFENYVVVAKDLERNALVVAFESDRENGLWTRSVRIHSTNFLCEPLLGTHMLRVRTRFRDDAVPASLAFERNGEAEVHFQDPQRGLAPGQTLAFYDGNRLLGGGIYV
jgi:tRNA-specific 2-thiouridylase